MRRVLALLFVVVLVGAACGGGDDADTTTTTPAAAAASGGDSDGGTDDGSSDDTTADDPPDEPGVGAGSSTDFCQSAASFDTESLIDFDMSPTEIQSLFEDAADRLDEARGLAPSEIADDVALLGDTFRGYLELLAEHDYNFLAVPFEDPRLAAFDSDELEMASNRIANFCGLDFGGGDDGGSTPGGGVGITGGQVPEDFPEALVPPDVTSVGSATAGGTQVATFTSSASFDEIVAFYTGAFGEPFSVFEVAGVETAAYAGDLDGEMINVSVTGTEPISIIVTIGLS